MPLPKEQIYTIADIYALPEGERAELIDGQIYYMTPPNRRHQRIVTELCTIINNYIRSNNGTCEVDVAPFAVFLNEDDQNYVDPDKMRIIVYDLAHDDVNEYNFSDMVKAGIYPELTIDFGNLGLIY